MKRIIGLFIVMIIICSSCGGSREPDAQLDVLQVRNIAHLATLNCYYHNVAMGHRNDSSTWRFWEKNTKFWLWDRDTDFWIEYEGVITLGVDESKIKMNVDEENVTVTIPKAKVLDEDIVDATYDGDSEIKGADTTEPTIEEENKAIKSAQDKMEKTVKSDTILLNNAQIRAKEVIDNYIEEIGKMIKVNYKVVWNYE